MSTKQNLSDTALISMLAEDDQTALSALYDRYWHTLFSVAMHTLDSVEDAEEIVHDVFLNLWKLRHSLVLEKDLSHYLAAAVKYQVISKMRTEKRRLQLAETHYSSKPVTIAEDTTELWLREKEMVAQIEQGVSSLPEKCQLVFRLSREEGLSNKEIAEKLEITVNTVDTHLTKALKLLRQFFKRALLFLFL
ncbi:RNA polymerase sigma-70 factor, ECF subfamily [bacterium A37T11]|nr:RNA polymerase sigma-70 factor, ECF subfamily [bacterium A37T11]